MVRNEKGGKGAKGLARKAVTSSGGREERLRLPSCELEKLACVTNMYGNGMCEIHLNDNTKLIGHIRNKFRGRQKRSNMILRYSVVMIGLREWENPIKNCDILCIYDDNQIEQLKTIPQINVSNIMKLKLSGTPIAAQTGDLNDNLVFTTETDEDLHQMLNEVSAFDMETEEDVDIEDI
jgi:translation initiation factor IF-1